MTDKQLPEAVITEIQNKRTDINWIHFDDAYFEDVTDEWVVPVEAWFSEEEGDGKAGWNHGNMRIEIDPELGLDYSVEDWTPGYHPDMHTFEGC